MSDDIDVNFNEEHPLPWHPPICERLTDTVEGIDDIPGVKERHTLTTRSRDPHAVPYLLKYGHQGVEAEIGQRISSAMKKVQSLFHTNRQSLVGEYCKNNADLSCID